MIVEDLGRAIITDRYAENNSFPIEADLCRHYCVGRGTLREAVKMLTAKGLLGVGPGQGTWVQPEDAWDLLDPDVLRWLLARKPAHSLLIEFTQMRLAVEPNAAWLAALVAAPTEKVALMEAIGQMAAAERGEDDPFASGIAFHAGVMRASGNRFYAQFANLIDTALRFSIRITNYSKGVNLVSLVDHKKVADAILAHDAPAAEVAMRSLIKGNLDVICSVYGLRDEAAASNLRS
jgi:DNA-binding FadR family transcriptional regulator